MIWYLIASTLDSSMCLQELNLLLMYKESCLNSSFGLGFLISDPSSYMNLTTYVIK